MVWCSLFIIIWFDGRCFISFELASAARVEKYIYCWIVPRPRPCSDIIIFFISYFVIYVFVFDYSTRSDTICWISSCRKFIDFISLRFLTKLLSTVRRCWQNTRKYEKQKNKNMEQQIRFVVNKSLRKHSLVTVLSFYIFILLLWKREDEP